MGRWSRRVAEPLVDFADVCEGNVVLDAGCGTGALAFAASAVPSVLVTGVDPSEVFIRAARQRVADHRVQFEVGDAQQLRFPDDSFDRAISLLVLNFLPDSAAALREMIRVTRPNGVVAAAVWEYGGMEMLRVYWEEAVALFPDAAQRDERRMLLCKHGNLAKLWHASELRSVEERPVTIEMEFSSFDDFWQPFLEGQGPAGVYTVSLGESAREALKSRLLDRLWGGAADEPLMLPARAWAVRGIVA